MELGIVGLGRMGANMARRLMKDGHTIVAYDVNPDAVKALAGEGATGASSLEDLAAKLTAPRSVWVMVPAGKITEETVQGLEGVLESGDAIIDGGNSYYRDDMRRGQTGRRERDRLRRLRHQRRRLRPRARLLPDDRRARRGGRAARPDLRLAGAGGRRRRSARRASPATRAPPRTATCTAARAARATS